MKQCLHCQEEIRNNHDQFCCLGCQTAYQIINQEGFQSYYQNRVNITSSALKPENYQQLDLAEIVKSEGDRNDAKLMIDGIQCAACIWLIENIIKKESDVVKVRINLANKILSLTWFGEVSKINDIAKKIAQIGYKIFPIDENILEQSDKKYNDSILKSLAIAAFGAGNIMLFSFSLWFSDSISMGFATRDLLHLFSSLIALPVIFFAAEPFFSSAYYSIKRGYPNMDLAISIAISLAFLVSLIQTFRGGEYVYFDSAVMLIFFLLIGRYLDLKARKKAFDIASEFSLLSVSFARAEIDGEVKILSSKKISEGMILIVAAGEKIAADGVVIEGESQIDASIINGESIYKNVAVGDQIFASTTNVSSPIKIKVVKTTQNSLLTKIIELSEEAEIKKNYFVRLADKVAKIYTPAVHLLAFFTFCLWFKNSFEVALMNAIAVLIITCPCALALAVPIIQSLTISKFLKKGILIKSGEVIEKIDQIDHFIFDKTGTLTKGQLQLTDIISHQNIDKKEILSIAALLASASIHPISKAITEARNKNFFTDENQLKKPQENLKIFEIVENKGFGIEAKTEFGDIFLGRADFCKIDLAKFLSFIKNSEISKNSSQNQLRCFFKYGEVEAVFIFSDQLKSDAKEIIQQLKKLNKKIILLSGDIEEEVVKTASFLGIEEFYYEKNPLEKFEFVNRLKNSGKKILLAGDGINDVASLALADISISFANASDLARKSADVIIESDKTKQIIDLINIGKKSKNLMKQNLSLALIYNVFAVPFAIMGFVSPLIAAIAMSSSSLLVVINSLRINKI
jgi:Cu2+-exporting ATPase